MMLQFGAQRGDVNEFLPHLIKCA